MGGLVAGVIGLGDLLFGGAAAGAADIGLGTAAGLAGEGIAADIAGGTVLDTALAGLGGAGAAGAEAGVVGAGLGAAGDITGTGGLTGEALGTGVGAADVGGAGIGGITGTGGLTGEALGGGATDFAGGAADVGGAGLGAGAGGGTLADVSSALGAGGNLTGANLPDVTNALGIGLGQTAADTGVPAALTPAGTTATDIATAAPAVGQGGFESAVTELGGTAPQGASAALADFSGPDWVGAGMEDVAAGGGATAGGGAADVAAGAGAAGGGGGTAAGGGGSTLGNILGYGKTALGILGPVSAIGSVLMGDQAAAKLGKELKAGAATQAVQSQEDKALVGQEQAGASQALAAYNAGTLMPPQQAQIDKYVQNSTNQLRQLFANSGRDYTNDTDYLQGVQQIQQNAIAMAGQFLTQNLNAAIQQANAATGQQQVSSQAQAQAQQGVFQAAQISLAQDQTFQAAIANAFKGIGLLGGQKAATV